MSKHPVSLLAAALVMALISLPARAGANSSPMTVSVPPVDVKALLENFQEAQAMFKSEQEDLRRKLNSSNREKRKVLRERLQANREKWLEEATKLQEDIRDRVREVKAQLAAHSDLVEDAKERVKDHRGK
jgi:hypothetical protein